MSAPVLRRLFNALGTVQAEARTSSIRQRSRRENPQREPQSLPTATSSKQRPPGPTLRANPFPEVTDLFCRLPLSTLFYRPEASNLGDLMRLLVRPGVRIIHATGFSWIVGSVPKRSKNKRLSQCAHHFSRQADSMVCTTVNKKRKLSSGPPATSPVLFELPHYIHSLVWDY